MKLISISQGAVALHAAADEVIPDRGVSIPDLVSFLGDVYQFSMRPIIEPNTPPQLYSNLYFQMGKALVDGEIFPITALGVVPNGDIISAQSTDIADRIAADFIGKLDDHFQYKMRHNIRRVSYLSNVIIKFDIDFESSFVKLNKVLDIINGRVTHDDRRFKLNRLGFSTRDAPQPSILTLDGIDNADFTIERRVGSPPEENWYFSAAPLKTGEHLQVLSEIESALR